MAIGVLVLLIVCGGIFYFLRRGNKMEQAGDIGKFTHFNQGDESKESSTKSKGNS